MNRYLIDIRLMGSVKQQISDLSNQLHEKFSLGDKRIIPHISLVGPFSTDNEEKLLENFTRICREQTVIPQYEIGGYDFFDTSRVIFVRIEPDENLRQFRYRLSQALAPSCSLRAYDLDDADTFRFHSTLAMKLDWLTFQRIKWYFRGQKSVRFRHHPIRVTLLRNSRLVCEYDFVQERMLTRAQALSKATMMRDFDLLKSLPDGSWED
jgi:2'-5' RNA ligase